MLPTMAMGSTVPLIAMLAAAAALVADPVPPGVHESRMAKCGVGSQKWWYQRLASKGTTAGKGSTAGQVVLAGDGLDGQHPGDPTMCLDVSCGEDAKGFTCGSSVDWPDNQELRFFYNDSSIRWLAGTERCGGPTPLCLFHASGQHATMVPCSTDTLVTDPAGQWKAWGSPLTNSSAVPLVNTASGECFELLPAGQKPPAPPPLCVNGDNATGTTLCGCASDDAPTTGQPNGGQITLACVGPAGAQGGKITKVLFTSFGTPDTTAGCGKFAPGSCSGDPAKAKAAIEAACVGKDSCTVTCDIQHLNGGRDPCPGVPKALAVEVTCSDPQPPFPPPPPPPGPPLPPLPKGQFSPCNVPGSVFSTQPWCTATLAPELRVTDMLKRMSVEEKLQYLMIRSPAAPSLGLPPYNWWEEATHGVGTRHENTNVAFPITTGMSFNRTLWKATGALIGTEARALMNIGGAGSDFWAPVVNLARDGRWGRNLETPGEDPYVSGEYATNFVQGFQESEADETHLMASACCKHYVANSVEHTEENHMTWDRFEIDSEVTQQDLVDSYMPAFQACVEKGRVSGLMCSLNAVNGVPACANDCKALDAHPVLF